MGVTGVHAEAGLTTGDFEEAAIKSTLSRNAAETFVLASAEKIGVVSPYLVLELREAAGIITDQSVAAESLEPFKQMGLSVIQAG